MHDGVMVSMDNLNPNGQAAKQVKTHIDKEILQDLTFHTRQQLNCWIQLAVKSGHSPTDITCDVPNVVSLSAVHDGRGREEYANHRPRSGMSNEARTQQNRGIDSA